LLLVDPPLNAADLFVLPARAAALFTGAPLPIGGLSVVATQPGGLAHLRIGEHLLDVYSHAQSNIVLLPLTAILCGGAFGSDATLPIVAAGSDGGEELGVLRLLATLVRERNVQLYLPREGSPLSDRVEMMERLADDVAYLHALRRVAGGVASGHGGLHEALALAETLLPTTRKSPANQVRHAANISAMYAAAASRQIEE
jgi:hypothetical protein